MTTGIAILGSTGSIGCNTLRVIETMGGRFRVVALAAGRNAEKLAEQVARFRPELIAVENDECAREVARFLRAKDVKLPMIRTGESGLIEVATYMKAETIVTATVGAVGLVPTLRALEAGKRVALANKEPLVMAGELVMRTARESGAEVLPIDSEHNAVHQCLRGERAGEVKRLILTASGGPFRNATRAEMERATIADAMRHPTWQMGAKITIDSATLMNKGLEVIEAHWLFGTAGEAIEVVVHPESVVHSMVEMIDGSVIAQMGVTDMRHAIQYALTYPERCEGTLEPLDLTRLAGLHFEAPDMTRFPCLRLAYEALAAGGTVPAAMNAANEEAVQAFLDERIALTDIPVVIEDVMHATPAEAADTLETILRIDRLARANARKAIAHLTKVVSA
ncbi:MAG: 1-deoxy-D-xylulose-5-phosphate reductoisomerase [Pyrinomonadaceae bacterium MAG19_C2-C3]|nr:1-deoxy-D-xylulose-5-phosphate reductoisomerase [Pyrinomonadaceae bacterium MAG19_C2-C3]